MSKTSSYALEPDPLQEAQRTAKRKRTTRNFLIGILVGLASCLLGVIAIGATTSNADPATPSPGRDLGRAAGAAATSAAPKVAPPADTRATIEGNDQVHVGEDIPAGTYRTDEKVTRGDLCYWSKTRDAEGRDIIDNDIPSGGRPQVTLKNGQWFESSGCPDWYLTK